MRVRMHPAGRGAVGHYRLIWPAEAAKAQGHDVELDHDHVYRTYMQPAVLTPDRLVGLAEAPDCDVAVFQIPLERTRVEFIDALQAAGVAVVVDVDDDFHSIHPKSPAWRDLNPLHSPDKNRDWLMRACQRADLVTVPTVALAERYGAHGRVRVIPNYVPAHYLRIAAAPELGPRPEGVTVGWTGSIATHVGDLNVTGGGVASAVDDAGARFEVVGTGNGVRAGLGLAADPAVVRVEATIGGRRLFGWLPLDAYPEALARLDVGIVPLKASPFNEAKSWLKGVEMAAVGVPFVATPTAEYRRLHALGAGLLADTPSDWYRYVGMLATSESMRFDLLEAGRAVAETLTIDAHVGEWLDAWDTARRHRTNRIAA